MTKAERERRREAVLFQLREVWWGRRGCGRRVTLALQRGRKRPLVSGRIAYVATSGAFVLVDDGGDEPLHVPLDVIRSVEPA
jgi:hypothetical protein